MEEQKMTTSIQVKEMQGFIATLGPDFFIALNKQIFEKFNQGFRIMDVRKIGNKKRVQVRLKTGINKTFTF